LRQSLLDFETHRLGSRLGSGRQGGSIAGAVPAQVGHGQNQVAGQRVKDRTQDVEVGRLAQHVEEAGQIPGFGNLILVGDIDQAAQRRITVQLGQAVVRC
jgi:hypothetical protein